MRRATQPARTPEADDIALWPDGSWARLENLRRGEFDWMSDDWEIIAHTDEARLREVGILDQLI